MSTHALSGEGQRRETKKESKADSQLSAEPDLGQSQDPKTMIQTESKSQTLNQMSNLIYLRLFFFF